MITLRNYQDEAIEALFGFWRAEAGNPLIELATGLGKSLVVAEVCRRIVQDYPNMRIMMLVHSRELVRQNYEELLRIWPMAPVGVYSAGLNSRDTHHRILFASIQSVFRKPELFAPRHLIIVDEAHMIPADGDGMYLSFLDGLRQSFPKLKVLGLTATPYRLDSGRLDRGAKRIFDRIVYAYGVGEGTRDGWLAPLTARLGSVEIDVNGVARRGGEFVAADLNRAANREELIARTVDDIILRAENRKSWLLFCSGVDHAAAVAACLRNNGVSAAVVTGETPKDERDRLIADFKRGQVRALCNHAVLTTGFNAPGVDLIALLRPTLSTGLFVQMLGRGTRIAGVDVTRLGNAEARVDAIAGSIKPNCLVLDYAGNVRRHGPVDAIHIRDKKSKGEGGAEAPKVDVNDVRAKECPECGALAALNATRCPDCGHEYAQPKHEERAEDIAVMTREIREIWTPVSGWRCAKWTKRDAPDAPPTLRVDIMAGVVEYAEWVCFEHAGYARSKAALWWRDHGGVQPVPETVDEAILRFDELRAPYSVTIVADGKYFRIGKRRMIEVVE